ncbi:MAG: helix-turn-helix transcriptional regulator [Clostridia bacterium]|nr:helix-turn-helix transcriptional regulator [Clostridia bacterium]
MLPLAGILYLYHEVTASTEQNCAKNALSTVGEAASRLNSRLSWMESTAARFILDSQMTSMIYAEPLEYGDKRINTFNAFSRHLNDLIGEYDQGDIGFRMLFQNSELVFYDDAISHGLAFVYEHALHYCDMTYEQWYEAVFSGTRPSLLPLQDIHLGNIRVKALTYNYPIVRRSSTGERKAVLQFFIQEHELIPEDFNPLSTGYFLTAEGFPLATFGAMSSFPEKADDTSGTTGWQRLPEGLLVTAEIRDGMRLAMLVPDEVAFRDVHAMRLPLLMGFFTFAAIEGLLILYLAKRNARPIESLASDMTQVLDMPRQGNELQYIHQGILQLQQNQQTALQRSRQIETALLLNRLLNQRTDDVEVLLQSGDKLGIDLRAGGYCAAVIQLPKGTAPAPGAMMPEPPDDMRVIIGEGRRNRLNVLYLIDAEAAVEHTEYISAHLQQLYGQMPQGTRIGQGRICAALDDVTFSFNQAMYCFQQEQNTDAILSFDQVSPGANSLYFPLEQQQRIINAVKHNNADILDQEFGLILHENTVRRHLSALMKRTLLSSIEALLMMAAEDVSRQDNLPDYLRSIHRSDDFRTELEVLRQEFHNIAEQVGGRYAQISNQRTAMESYLEEHFSDSMLSISSMAEDFGFSESYFSVLFKETLGEPYSAYLEKLRLNKAGELLQSTELSIEDISQMVGYNNSTTFRRAFKRVKGLSPQQYRNQESV